MDNNIKGKVVVITGASSGLGEASARHLAAQGASVALGARRQNRIEARACFCGTSEITPEARRPWRGRLRDAA